MSVGTVSPESAPRDIDELMKLRPSVRFRLMNQMGALPGQSDKAAYSSAKHDEQCQRLLETLKARDANGGSAPVVAAPAVPAQQAAPAAGPPAMPPQPSAPQGGPPAMPPAQGGNGVQMPGLPGLPGLAQAGAIPGAPQPRQNVRMAPQQPPAPQQDDREPSFQTDEEDPLSTIIANQAALAESLNKIAGSMQHMANAVQQMQEQVTSGSRVSGISLLLLTTFAELGMQKGRDQIAAELQAGILGGELEQLVQSIVGEAQG